MASDLTVRNSVADTDDHVVGLLKNSGFLALSINANPSHLQLATAEQGFIEKPEKYKKRLLCLLHKVTLLSNTERIGSEGGDAEARCRHGHPLAC